MNQFIIDFFNNFIFPNINNFRIIKIYKFELTIIDDLIAKSSNNKSIYSALDKPDFRLLRNNIRIVNVIKLSFKKMGFSDVEINFQGINNSITLENKKYNLLFFSIGELPYIDVNLGKTIVMFYVNDFSKIYFCGIKNGFNVGEYYSYNNKNTLSNFKYFESIE